jgi:hypothetical protein
MSADPEPRGEKAVLIAINLCKAELGGCDD